MTLKTTSPAVNNGDGTGSGTRTPGPEKGHEVHWGYQGARGPGHWGELSPGFSLCKSGKCQAPIDITGAAAADLGNIEFAYGPTDLRVIDNGHTIQVDYAAGSYMRVGGNAYQLLQFHFHSPGENTVNGKSFAMELHLVHEGPRGQLAVVGVFFDIGKRNPLIQAIWDNIPGGTVHGGATPLLKINAAGLLPANGSYFYFEGSLTTPPCTEGVAWYVLKNARHVSGAQVKKFLAVIGANARPVQPLNGRTVLEVNTGRTVIRRAGTRLNASNASNASNARRFPF